MAQSAYAAAYRRWFSAYERERLRQKKRRGAAVENLPPPPAHPDDIAAAVERIGRSRVLAWLSIHPATLRRWQTGRAVIPRPCWLLLLLLDSGRLPGMSADWVDFRFDGDALIMPGTRWRYTARELAGLPMLDAYRAQLERDVAALKKQIAHLVRVGDFGAANDPMRISGA